VLPRSATPSGMEGRTPSEMPGKRGELKSGASCWRWFSQWACYSCNSSKSEIFCLRTMSILHYGLICKGDSDGKEWKVGWADNYVLTNGWGLLHSSHKSGEFSSDCSLIWPLCCLMLWVLWSILFSYKCCRSLLMSDLASIPRYIAKLRFSCSRECKQTQTGGLEEL
jgi:hypothetical protein